MKPLLFLCSLIAAMIIPSEDPEQKKLVLSIVYDNYYSAGDTKADWGFSCLIEGLQKTILFDTGTKSHIFSKNADQLEVNFQALDALVISHNHMDHTGNIGTVLKYHPELPIYFPQNGTKDYLYEHPMYKENIIKVDGPVVLCDRLTLTGELPGRVWEQSMVIETKKGLVIITGCAHPGIVNIIHKAQEICSDPIYMVLGGFHLIRHSKEEVNGIIEQFKTMGIKKCGASHCTGDEAIEMFRSAYGDDFVELGTGARIEIPI